MKCTHRVENDIYIVYPEGNLMTGSIEQLYAYIGSSLGDETIKGFLINFKDVIHIDSTGLGGMMFIYKKYLKHQIRLLICQTDENIREIFRATELDKIINVYETEEEAFAAFDNAT